MVYPPQKLNCYGIEMSLPAQGFQVYVGDEPNLHVVERQTSDQANTAVLSLGEGIAQIRSFPIESDTQFRASLCVRKLDMHIAAVDCLLEKLDRLFRAQADFD